MHLHFFIINPSEKLFHFIQHATKLYLMLPWETIALAATARQRNLAFDLLSLACVTRAQHFRKQGFSTQPHCAISAVCSIVLQVLGKNVFRTTHTCLCVHGKAGGAN